MFLTPKSKTLARAIHSTHIVKKSLHFAKGYDSVMIHFDNKKFDNEPAFMMTTEKLFGNFNVIIASLIGLHLFILNTICL